MKRIVTCLLVALSLGACSAKSDVRTLYLDGRYEGMSDAMIIQEEDLAPEERAMIIEMRSRERIREEKSGAEAERDRKLAEVIGAPVSPLLLPDTVLRVLLLPYVDDTGTLNTWKYTFVKVEEGRWILGDYLRQEQESAVKFLRPISGAKDTGDPVKEKKADEAR